MEGGGREREGGREGEREGECLALRLARGGGGGDEAQG